MFENLTSLRAAIAGVTGVLLASCTPNALSPDAPPFAFLAGECEVGIYGEGEDFVVITRRGEHVRFTFSNGQLGRVERGSRIECGKGSVRIDGAKVAARRDLKETDTRFASQGSLLAGRLIEPVDANADTPLVALAHGSEELGWIDAVAYPYQLAGRGVSVFVYDKRGTGLSQGTYSQNFPDLASDLAAASLEAQRLAQGRFGRFGLMGFSQGGWVVPLAAERAGAEFIGIGYGLVVDILEEDASQVQLELSEAGYGAEVLEAARRITDVTARLAVSEYTDGLDELDALRAQYGDQPWFAQIRGGFTGVILGISSAELREKGIPMFDRLNIDWSVTPMDALRQVDVPQLWVLAAQDREAPIAKTLERLQALRGDGKDVRIFVFPETDHGMREFKQRVDGARETIRITDRYYDLLADWAKGRVEAPYGTSAER